MSYAKAITVEFDGNKVARDLRKAGARLEIGQGTFIREVTSRAASGAREYGSALGGVHHHVLPGIIVMGGNRIRLDARSHPAILGAEFGGGRRPTTQQFPPWRGAGRGAGYMLYPAIRDEEQEADRILTSLIEKAL